MKPTLYFVEGLPGSFWATGSQGVIVDSSCIDFRGTRLRDGYFHGRVEWQGIDLETGERVFDSPVHLQSTINIGEFCAIVDGMKWLHSKGKFTAPVYSDSKIAIDWVLRRTTSTSLPLNHHTAEAHYDLRKSLEWIIDNKPANPVFWWNSRKMGENLADFGRKTNDVYQ